MFTELETESFACQRHTDCQRENNLYFLMRKDLCRPNNLMQLFNIVQYVEGENGGEGSGKQGHSVAKVFPQMVDGSSW